jgi:hypothetical protein
MVLFGNPSFSKKTLEAIGSPIESIESHHRTNPQHTISVFTE